MIVASRAERHRRTKEILRDSFAWSIGNTDTHRSPLGPLILQVLPSYQQASHCVRNIPSYLQYYLFGAVRNNISIPRSLPFKLLDLVRNLPGFLSGVVHRVPSYLRYCLTGAFHKDPAWMDRDGTSVDNWDGTSVDPSPHSSTNTTTVFTGQNQSVENVIVRSDRSSPYFNGFGYFPIKPASSMDGLDPVARRSLAAASAPGRMIGKGLLPCYKIQSGSPSAAECSWPLGSDFFFTERMRGHSYGTKRSVMYNVSHMSPFSLSANQWCYSATDRTPDSASFTTCSLAPVGCKIPPPKMADFQWTWLTGYEVKIKYVIGSGAFAEVKDGEYQNRQVVIKMFKSTQLTSLTSALREADMCAYMMALGIGPPIIGLLKPDPRLNLGPLPGLVFRTLLRGNDFQNILQTPLQLTFQDILNILVQVARLVAVMHSEKFLHNDIKANNILITPNMAYYYHPRSPPPHDSILPAPHGVTGTLTHENRHRVYLLDFGSATCCHGFRVDLDEAQKKHYGKTSYLAPEVINGEESTCVSDVYSVGMLLADTYRKYPDTRLRRVLRPIIGECLMADPEERPSMEDVERYLANKADHVHCLR